MLKIETNNEGRVTISGTSIFTHPHMLAAFIEQLKQIQNKMIAEQEKKAMSDNFYELFQE